MENETIRPGDRAFVENPHFTAVRDIVFGRCAMCHTAEPYHDGIVAPPKSVLLDSDAAIVARAREIALQAGFSMAMPPGNVSFMEPKERALIVTWYRESLAAAGRLM